MRLDKSTFTRQSMASASNHQRDYAKLPSEKRGQVFHYLMGINYGFADRGWPKLDKTSFQARKRR